MPGDAQSNQLPPPPQILERQTLRGLAAQTLEVLDHVAAAAAAPAPTAATSGDGAADPKAATAAGPAKAARERGVRVAVALHNTLPAPPSPQARSSPSSCGPMRCVPGGGTSGCRRLCEGVKAPSHLPTGALGPGDRPWPMGSHGLGKFPDPIWSPK